MNLRRDPFERADSNTYYDWMVDHIPLCSDLRRSLGYRDCAAPAQTPHKTGGR
jgi:hypothetical protein